MPKVDPQTGQPMTDDPSHPDPDVRGGKDMDDPDLQDAKPNGAVGTTVGKIQEKRWRGLPGEKPSDG